ncbi:MAG: DEAD/DEAH box helicase [Candidatus Aenigmarchaeota archaeon]|nr:DEAD/DEAH box helicase [Candidatus Aenigmarchaeota archaeon]
MSFRSLGICEPVLKAIEEEKFEKPSSIQIKTIPLVVKGKDVIAESSTGSGKTLAFGSGIIQRAERGKGIQALVLTPTRELAEQETRALRMFSRYKHLEVMSIYGGVSINPQIEKLRTVDVVVGTPGRILDHIGRRTIRLADVKVMVLDEADRMLDMGFIDDVERIISECPKERQTLLFSATVPFEVERLAKRYMRDPVRVSAESQVDPRKLHQVYYDVDQGMKFSLLVHLLKHEESGLVMVFCNSRRNTDFVANNLKASGVEAEAIHGGLTQDRRTRIMDRFHSKSVYVLVCTDVASRGLDIQGVSHIYNYDIPSESKQYIHRIGRTARAGKEGKAINLLCPKDFENFTRVLHDFNVDVTKEKRPYIKRAEIRWRDPSSHSSGPSRYGSGPRRGPSRGSSRGPSRGGHRRHSR